MSFEALNVKPEIIKALTELGITKPTTIQTKAIPLIKAGHDVIGISRTGSGKTCAFGVPLIENVVRNQGVQALIIAPTRELAVQISHEFVKFSRYHPCSTTAIYGGVSIVPQIKQLTHTDIVVGTPGRLLDHLQRNTLNLSTIKCVVLDEADKMVEMGFIEDIEKILECMPNNRQILLFGATISDEIDHIKKKYMHNPSIAEAEMHVEADLLQQFYYNVEQHQKFSLLVHLLKKEQPKRAIIFCSTRATVDIVTENLRMQGIHATMIHGKLTQSARLRIIEGFHRGNPSILVASAVAARGLDIKDVTHIINYDLSKDPQEYLHRVGRTARAGEEGKAITLLSQRDYDTFSSILNRHRFDVKELPLEDFPRLTFKARSRSYDGDRSYGRGGGGYGHGGGRPQHGGGYRDRAGYASHQGDSRPSYGHSGPSSGPRRTEGGYRGERGSYSSSSHNPR